MSGKKIAILGWAFKANTNDSRESAAIYVAEKLYEAGASLEIYDPMVPINNIVLDIKRHWSFKFSEIKLKSRVKFLSSIDLSKEKYDAIAIITEWADFKLYEWNKLNPKTVVFDGINLLEKSNQII